MPRGHTAPILPAKATDMKKVYFLLALVGFLLPNYLVLQESLETGNILLYADITATLQGMFANRISTIFSIDLFVVVFIFLIWTFQHTPATQRPKLYLLWLSTFLFGLGSGFPLYLYWRETWKAASEG